MPAMLRLLTWNLGHYDDDAYAAWPRRLEALARILADARPDVVALQEVRFNPAHPSTRATYQDMAQQVLARLAALAPAYEDATVVTAPSQEVPPGTPRVPSVDPPRGWEGLAVISRLPVLETGARRLTRAPGCEDENQRLVQHAVLRAAAGPFHVFHTHFALPSDDPARPCIQANVAETLDHVRRRAEGPFVLLGDLNVEPEDARLERVRDAGLVDAWTLRRPRDPGHTWNAMDPKGPTKRLDYAWIPASLAERVTDARQVGAEPAEGVFASDHRGVMVTLDL